MAQSTIKVANEQPVIWITNLDIFKDDEGEWVNVEYDGKRSEFTIDSSEILHYPNKKHEDRDSVIKGSGSRERLSIRFPVTLDIGSGSNSVSTFWTFVPRILIGI